MSKVYSKAMSSVVEGDRVAIHWNFELTEKSGKVRRFDEIRRDEQLDASAAAMLHENYV